MWSGFLIIFGYMQTKYKVLTTRIYFTRSLIKAKMAWEERQILCTINDHESWLWRLLLWHIQLQLGANSESRITTNIVSAFTKRSPSGFSLNVLFLVTFVFKLKINKPLFVGSLVQIWLDEYTTWYWRIPRNDLTWRILIYLVRGLQNLSSGWSYDKALLLSTTEYQSEDLRDDRLVKDT